MPAEVIDRVHTLARRSRADRGGIEFGNRYGDLIADDNDSLAGDSDDDTSYASEPETEQDDSDDDDGHAVYGLPGNDYNNQHDDVPLAGVANNDDDVPLAGVDNDANEHNNHDEDDDHNAINNEDNIIQQPTG
jgi:hypothetical protein